MGVDLTQTHILQQYRKTRFTGRGHGYDAPEDLRQNNQPILPEGKVLTG